MLRRLGVLGIAAAVVGIGAAEAQQSFPGQERYQQVTAVTKTGERVSGAFQDLANNQFYIRTGMHDDRRLPRQEVVLLDFAGNAQGLPDTELRHARGDNHVMVLRDGNVVTGQFLGIEGGGKENFDLRVAFRSQGGEERRVRINEVTRLYLGRVDQNVLSGTGGATATSGDGGATRSVRVPANSRWVDTQITVQQGQTVNVRTSGEVNVGNNVTAGAAGARTGERAPSRAPLPNLPMGALVGRIGNGAAFAIGDQSSFPAPSSGQLFLMVNDDVVSDNSGEFTVELSTTGGPTQQQRRR
jgi:hypothetical protein